MAFHRQGKAVAVNAAAVVGDRDQAAAAVFHHHFDALGAGVDGVFHQLLHRRGGAFHDLAGGDAVDQ